MWERKTTVAVLSAARILSTEHLASKGTFEDSVDDTQGASITQGKMKHLNGESKEHLCAQAEIRGLEKGRSQSENTTGMCGTRTLTLCYKCELRPLLTSWARTVIQLFWVSSLPFSLSSPYGCSILSMNAPPTHTAMWLSLKAMALAFCPHPVQNLLHEPSSSHALGEHPDDSKIGIFNPKLPSRLPFHNVNC